MRPTTRKAALAAALCLAATGAPRAARASGYLDAWHPYQTYWAIAWQAGFPVLELEGLVGQPAWVGGSVAFRVGVVQRLALGLAADWSWFTDTSPFGVVQRPDYTVTGPSYRRVSFTSALATLHWYLNPGNVQPYLGVGVGAVWFDSRIQSVDVKDTSNGAALAVVPEVGVLFTLVPRFGLFLSGTYHWTQADVAGVKDAQWVGAQLGAAYYF